MVDAINHVASFGIYGVIWLTRELVVEKKFGPLVDFVQLGAPVTDSVIALIGMEAEILAMRDRPRRVLELPAVGVPDGDGHTKRMNFTFFWQADTDRPMLLVYRANSQTEIELELSRQIRARLMAESEIVAKSRELARANADLESFAAIVSHDLKAPLRHMRHIADLMITDAEINGNEKAAERLKQMQSLSRRMSHMLTELLDYASLGRKYEAIVHTDTGALAQSIADSIPAGSRTIEVGGDWPVMPTLAAPLDLVLRNLIQNAIQHHDRDTGRICVTCTNTPTALDIAVTDDGPGIEPRHHTSVFLPFRTLGPQNGGQAGTGIGLAMVKKVVETAGGSVTVISDPATRRGSTFAVRWPKLIRT